MLELMKDTSPDLDPTGMFEHANGECLGVPVLSETPGVLRWAHGALVLKITSVPRDTADGDMGCICTDWNKHKKRHKAPHLLKTACLA